MWLSLMNDTATWKEVHSIVNDVINHPSHYTDGKIEVIDFIEDKKLNFNLGNVIKYVCRAGKKHSKGKSMDLKALEDLEKAAWYINREIQTRKGLLTHEDN